MSEPQGRAAEPLRPRIFAILLALAAGPRHGYGLMQELQKEPGEGWLLGPATLYRTLKEMERAGMIATADGPDEESGGPPRRYYRLTARGRTAGSAEATRMASVAHRWQRVTA